MTFEIYFLIKIISKISNTVPEEKYSLFNFVL